MRGYLVFAVLLCAAACSRESPSLFPPMFGSPPTPAAATLPARFAKPAPGDDARRVYDELMAIAAVIPPPGQPVAAPARCDDTRFDEAVRWPLRIDYDLLRTLSTATDGRLPDFYADPFVWLTDPTLVALARVVHGGDAFDRDKAGRALDPRAWLVKVYRARTKEMPRSVNRDGFYGGLYEGDVIFIDRRSRQIVCAVDLRVENSASIDPGTMTEDFMKNFARGELVAVWSISAYLLRGIPPS